MTGQSREKITRRFSMKWKMGAGAALCFGVMTATMAASAQNNPSPRNTQAPVPALADLEIQVYAPQGVAFPRFKVDAAWPKMPSDLMIGQVAGVAVDKDDDVWLVHRPHSLTATDIGLAQSPPQAVCCKAAPTVVRFSNDGRYLGGWGGPETGPVIDGVNQWPKSVHGLYVDGNKTVWFGGNGDGDHAVLNFTADGKFIRSIGRREKTGGNGDKAHLGNPADVYAGGGQILVADGYINKRVIRFTGKDSKFSGYWGAYAKAPEGGSREGNFDQSQATSTSDGGANPKSPNFGDIVHCVVPTNDGYVYICDRRNNRAQLFRQAANGELSFVRDIAIAPETGGTRTVTDIAVSPDGKYLYVADMMNGRIWILLRENDQVLAAIGRNGRQAGQFTWLHSLDIDSRGNLYVSEVSTGRRIQKLVFTGIE